MNCIFFCSNSVEELTLPHFASNYLDLITELGVNCIISGGMQDYNYIWEGCMELTLELSCCKYPYRHELSQFWMDNKQALLTYLGEAHRGVRGLITDINGNPIPRALLMIKGRNISFKSSDKGEIWRILLPGTYTVEVKAEGFESMSKTFTVNDGEITEIYLQLTPNEFVS